MKRCYLLILIGACLLFVVSACEQRNASDLDSLMGKTAVEVKAALGEPAMVTELEWEAAALSATAKENADRYTTIKAYRWVYPDYLFYFNTTHEVIEIEVIQH